MHPKNHANLMRFLIAVCHPITMIALFFLFVIISISTGVFYVMFVWFGSFILRGVIMGNDFLYSLPVHCDNPGCDGAIEKVYTQKSNNEAQIQYKCPSCGSVYETTIHILQDPEDDIRPW